MRGVFITGTSTAVGKTVVAAGITMLLARSGVDVVACKPFATSNRPFSKHFKSKDVALLANASQAGETDAALNPSFYPLAASPYMASTLLKMAEPDLNVISKSVTSLAARHDFAVVEGIGGIMVPLTKRETLAQFVSRLGFPVIIVTTPFLGTLNHTLLTILACRAHKIKIEGIIVNMMPSRPSTVERETSHCIEHMTGIDVIAVLRRQGKVAISAIADSLGKDVMSRLLAMDQL